MATFAGRGRLKPPGLTHQGGRRVKFAPKMVCIDRGVRGARSRFPGASRSKAGASFRTPHDRLRGEYFVPFANWRALEEIGHFQRFYHYRTLKTRYI